MYLIASAAAVVFLKHLLACQYFLTPIFMWGQTDYYNADAAGMDECAALVTLTLLQRERGL